MTCARSDPRSSAFIRGRSSAVRPFGRRPRATLARCVLLPDWIDCGVCRLRPWTLADEPSLVRHADSRNVWRNLRDQFPHPYTFDIRRSPNDHVAFGRMSPHLCLGAQLARMELKVLFEELLPRISDVRSNGPVERLRSNFISGIKRLPISLSTT